MLEDFLYEKEQVVADLARKYRDLKKEYEQFLLTQVSGFGCTLRQANEEVEALRKKRTEQGGLYPKQVARLGAIVDTPEMISLSKMNGQISQAVEEYCAAKSDLDEFKAALSNHTEDALIKEREQDVADLARKYGDLKKEYEQLLQAQVSGFGCTLRQADEELELLEKKRTEQGGLSARDFARVEAIVSTPEMISLWNIDDQIYEALEEYNVAKDDLEEFRAALSNNAQHSPKMVDATATLHESAGPNTGGPSGSAQVQSIDTPFEDFTSKNLVALTRRRVWKPRI